MSRPRIITKKTEAVIAYIDTAVFHIAKGEDPVGNHFGIVPSSYADPFTMTFDNASLTCSLQPGIISIYGRQVELNAAVQVFDFHSTVESQKMFCTVFFEINLEDSTSQTVTIKLDISGASYKNFKQRGIQDNLYKLTHGVFQAPVARFTYTPTANVPFADYELIAWTYAEAGRASVLNLRPGDKINGNKVSDLAEVLDKPIKKLVFNIASNENALVIYKSLPSRTPSSPGYSKAKVAQSIGTHENATEVDENLTGITTMKRIKLVAVTNIFGTAALNIKMQVPVDWEHLQSVRIWFKDFSLTGKAQYREKETETFGVDNWARRTMECEKTTSDYWYGLMDLNDTLPEFVLVCDWRSWGFGDTHGTTLKMSKGYRDNLLWGEDGFLKIYGIPLAAYQAASHIHAHLYFERRGGRTYFCAKGIGDSVEYSQNIGGLNWAWWKYKELTEVVASGEIYADFIYKGDVRL